LQILSKTDAKKALEDARFIIAIADSLPGLFAYWDKNLRCRFANYAYLEWFGKAPEDVIGNSLLDLMGEQLFALNEPYIRAVLAGTPQKFERTLTKADGSIGYTWVNYIPDINEKNEIEGFIAFVTDVSFLKQSEIELKRSEANLQAILDNSPFLTWLKDVEGHYLKINKVFSDYLRLEDANQAEGKTDLDLNPKDLAEKYRADDVEVMASRKQKHV